MCGDAVPSPGNSIAISEIESTKEVHETQFVVTTFSFGLCKINNLQVKYPHNCGSWVNCAAIPEPLLKSELFGYERGAFSRADSRKIGKFEQSHTGTIFLDEIGDMSLFTQAKILRVLQDQTFERLGGKETVKVDIRILAATNQNLEKAVHEKRFREDLFYRLNVVILSLPPLRERPEDIDELVEYFINRLKREVPSSVQGISPEVLRRFKSYSWPGNVRELENVLAPSSIPTKKPGHSQSATPRQTLKAVRDTRAFQSLYPENRRDSFGKKIVLEAGITGTVNHS